MFSRNSPLKRKHNEFRDPDYPQQEPQRDEDNRTPCCSSKPTTKRKKSGDGIYVEKESQNENYLHKVRQIIEREFQREIVMKQQQLEEIDDKLEKAKHILDRLRYAIVSAYYKKQEIPLTAADASTLRATNSLFERDDKGPQMPLHPSVKKLIGKRPKDISEVLRICPKRTAAQNAVQTIRAKSQTQKREERKLKKIIKEQGIVIDHSKQNATDNDVNALLNAAVQNNMKNSYKPTIPSGLKENCNKPSGKSLNAARLNNKIKHLFVVGNTSKYIGNEIERDIQPHTQTITHKWLVYVQSKETNHPIERFIKKVRFFLHRSYRPNDVVDIESPPFQVSRRGWGEFPIRVQLFFHSDFHQKPVQLLHNIVLDKTLSGIQTLGAETLLEIWLRGIKPTSPIRSEVRDTKPKIEIVEKEIPSQLHTSIIPRSDELVDDNLLDFLNKIEASPCSISSDIEKIQPTVLVNEHIGVKIKSLSPEKYKLLSSTPQKSPLKMPPLIETSNVLENPLTFSENSASANNAPASVPQSTSVSIGPTLKIPSTSSISVNTKPMTTFIRLPTSSTSVQFINNTVTQIPPLRPIMHSTVHVTKPIQSLTTTVQKPPLIVNREGKILMPSASVASAVRRTILPIVTSITNVSTPTSQVSQSPITNKPIAVSVPSSSSGSTIINVPKQILQKKLVQLVDSTGKIKYIQMLVAATSASSSVHNMNSSSVAPKLVTMAPSLVKNNTVTNTTQITKTVTTPFLRSPNGAHLVPAMTTKPNIFKIVPENRQTKPKVFTFSTTTFGTANANTVTTVNSQQKLQLATIAAAQTIGKMPTGAKPNNITLPVTNKSQKSNSNNVMTATKNLVFQKEGKVYIIDPQQMKYKQQQKKQVSLLKPQVSLLKQQHQKLITAPVTVSNYIDDTAKCKPPTAIQLETKSNVSQLNFASKQPRINTINALQLMQMKRMLFEKQFLRQEFTNVRPAVEYLLRRLKLIVPKESLVSDYPFVSHTLQDFQSLTAFKQRACEWLRAKNISRLIRNHKDLQLLNSSSKELFWSTKEIATFARKYAYTPPIKFLPRPDDQQQMGDNSTKGFTDLVKSELKQEHNLHYVTLSDHCKVRKWVDKVWHTLNEYEHHEDQHQIIDVDSMEEEETKKNAKIQTVPNRTPPHSQNYSLNSYLSVPLHLENQCQLVSDICNDLNIKLVHEELDTKVYYPSTQTVLAQCLHLFIEKLLRQSIALKQDKSTVSPSMIESICPLMPQDFAKVLASNTEFDFLTNNNFGSAVLAECLESSVKKETL